jgi:tetratricopeptide (TPR) repeat protein
MKRNPYVGPRAFKYGEKLYGRDREIMEVLDLLIAERIVLLHSPSGAGKTSLIQAALLPELDAEDFQVFPIMRVSSEPSPEEKEGLEIRNRYQLSAMLMIEKELPVGERKPLAELARLRLSDYLTERLTKVDSQKNIVLIFDQFEELLTIDPSDRSAKEAFFDEVGTFLRSPRCWALFSMREDYLAALDPYLRKVPTRLSNTFRLDLLDERTALNAIQEPCTRADVIFTDDAAQKLINDLRTIRIQQPDGTTEEQLGQYVEPVHLQVVCYQLWDKLPEKTHKIGIENIEKSGDVNAALAGYYAERVADIAVKGQVSEREIRGWFNNALITEQGIRGQVLYTPGVSQGLDDRAIWPLIDAHLVRAEKRRGATWFELAHDRLIKPIQTNNAYWLENNLHPFQRQAELWDRQRRPDGLLLHDLALLEADQWSQANQEKLTPFEKAFLQKCHEVRTREEEEQDRLREQARRDRRQARRFRRLAYLTSAVSVVCLVILIWALQTKRTLAATTGKLNATVVALDKKKGDLERTFKTLETTYGELAGKKQELEGKKLELEGTITKLNITNTKLNGTLSQLNRKNDELNVQLKVDKANRLGIQAYQRGEMNAAIRQFRIAEGLYTKSGNVGGEGWVLSNIGLSQRELKLLEDAITSYEDALSSLQSSYGDNSPETLAPLDGLGEILETQGDQTKEQRYYSLAESNYRKALAIRETTSDLDPLPLAKNLERLGDIYQKKNSYGVAVSYYQRAMTVKRDVYSPQQSLEIAVLYDKLGYTYRQAQLEDRYDLWKNGFVESESNYKRALEIRQGLLAAEHEDIAANLSTLATLYGEMSDADKDDDTEHIDLKNELNEIVLAMRDVPQGPDTPTKADKLFALAELYRRQERRKARRNKPVDLDYALALFERAIEMEKRLLITPSLHLADHLDTVAGIYVGICQDEKETKSSPGTPVSCLRATGFFENELTELRRVTKDNPDVGTDPLFDKLDQVARYHEGLNDFVKAEPLRKEALQLAEDRYGVDTVEATYSRRNLASVYREESRYAEAELLYKRVIAYWVQSLGPQKRVEFFRGISLPPGPDRDTAMSAISEHPDAYVGSNYELASIYAEQHKFAEAESLYKEGIDFLEWYGKAFAAGEGQIYWPTISNRYGEHRTVNAAELTKTINCLGVYYYNGLAQMYEAYAALLRTKPERVNEANELMTRAKSLDVEAERLRVTPCS